MADTIVDMRRASIGKDVIDDQDKAICKHKDTAVGPRDPVSTALNIPELLEAILSYSSARDLTRSITVSKQWQQVILGSIHLRRDLFLEPIGAKEFSYRGLKNRFPGRRLKTHVPKKMCKFIIYPHASFTAYHSRCLSGQGQSPSLDILKNFPAANLVAQPPPDCLAMECGGWTKVIKMRPSEKLTFGAATEALAELRAEHDKYHATIQKRCKYPEQDLIFMIWCTSRKGPKYGDVKATWKALVEAKSKNFVTISALGATWRLIDSRFETEIGLLYRVRHEPMSEDLAGLSTEESSNLSSTA